MPNSARHGAAIGLTMSLIAGTITLIVQNVALTLTSLWLGLGASVLAIALGGLLSLMMVGLNRLAPAWQLVSGSGALVGALGLGLVHGGRGVVSGLVLGALFGLMINLLFEPES